jgi:hypothetical protein
MADDWLGEILGFKAPKKRKSPLEGASEFWSHVAAGASALSMAFLIGSWILEKKK